MRRWRLRRRGAALPAAAIAGVAAPCASLVALRAARSALSRRHVAFVGPPAAATAAARPRCNAAGGGRAGRLCRRAEGEDAALAVTGADDGGARAWQRGLDKVFLDPDASPWERLWGLRDILQDFAGVPGAIASGATAIATKGLQAGGADALDAVFPQGTLARSDLEGLAAIARQAPEVIEDLQMAASAQAVNGFVPEAKPPDLNRIRDRLSRLMSFEGISDALIQSVESAFDGLRVTPRALQEPRYQVAARDEGFEVRLYTKFTAAVRRKPLPNARSKAIDPFNTLVSQVLDFDEGPLVANATMPMEIRYNTSSPSQLTAFFMAPRNVKAETRLFDSAAETEDEDAQPAAPVLAKPPPGGHRDVAFVEIPERALALRRFPGIATAAEVKRQYGLLVASLAVTGIYEPAQVGVFSVMQYNPPHTLPWRRRNEIALEVTYNAANAAKANARAAAMQAAAAAAADGRNDSEASALRAEMARQRNAWGSMMAELWQYLNEIRNSTVHVGEYMQLKELVERQANIHSTDVTDLRRTLDSMDRARADDAAQRQKAAARFESMYAEQGLRLDSFADRVEAMKATFIDRGSHEKIIQDLETHKQAHSASIAGLWTSLEGVRNTIQSDAARTETLIERLETIEGQRDAYSEAMQVLMSGVEELRARVDESSLRSGNFADDMVEYRRTNDEERDKMWKAVDSLRGKVVEDASQEQALLARLDSQREGQQAAIEALQKSMEVLRSDVEAKLLQEDLQRSVESQQEGLSELSRVVEELRGSLVDLTSKEDKLEADAQWQKDTADEGISEIWTSLDSLKESLDAERAQTQQVAQRIEAQRAAHDEGIESLTRSMAELKENLAKEMNADRFVASLDDHKAATQEGVTELRGGLESLREALAQERAQYQDLASRLEAQKVSQDEGIDALARNMASIKEGLMAELDTEGLMAELNAQKAAFEDSRVAYEQRTAELTDGVTDLKSVIERSSDSIATELEMQKLSSQTSLDELQANMEALQRNISEAFDARAAAVEMGSEDERAQRDQSIADLWQSLDELRATISEATANTGVSQEELTSMLEQQNAAHVEKMEALASSVKDLSENIAQGAQDKAIMAELEAQKASHAKHIQHLMKAVDDLRNNRGVGGFGIKA